jgi:hypothetical protein
MSVPVNMIGAGFMTAIRTSRPRSTATKRSVNIPFGVTAVCVPVQSSLTASVPLFSTFRPSDPLTAPFGFDTWVNRPSPS